MADEPASPRPSPIRRRPDDGGRRRGSTRGVIGSLFGLGRSSSENIGESSGGDGAGAGGGGGEIYTGIGSDEMRPGLMALAAAPVREALGADDAPPEAVSGMLWKLGANVKNWKERTFVLSEGRLCYYRRETDKKPAGDIRVHGRAVGVEDYDDGSTTRLNCIWIQTARRRYLIHAHDEAILRGWMVGLLLHGGLPCDVGAINEVFNLGLSPSVRYQVIFDPGQKVAAGAFLGANKMGFLEVGDTGLFRVAWQKRYVVLNAGSLYIYKSTTDSSQITSFELVDKQVGRKTFDRHNLAFFVCASTEGVRKDKVFWFSPASAEEQQSWVECLEAAIGSVAVDDLDRSLGAISFTIPPPVGFLALMFTDVQGSTRQWEAQPEAMAAALSIHNNVIRSSFLPLHGYEVKTEGDAFMVAFGKAHHAVQCALVIQERLMEADWPEEILALPDSAVELDDDGELLFRGLRVRIGIHVGTPRCKKDPVTSRRDYFGPMVNRAARVEGQAKGGQTLITEAVLDEVADANIPNLIADDLGLFSLKGIAEDVRLFEIASPPTARREFSNRRSGSVASSGPSNRRLLELNRENARLQKRLSAIMDKFDLTELDLPASPSSPDAALQEALRRVSESSRTLTKSNSVGVLPDMGAPRRRSANNMMLPGDLGSADDASGDGGWESSASDTPYDEPARRTLRKSNSTSKLPVTKSRLSTMGLTPAELSMVDEEGSSCSDDDVRSGDEIDAHAYPILARAGRAARSETNNGDGGGALGTVGDAAVSDAAAGNAAAGDAAGNAAGDEPNGEAGDEPNGEAGDEANHDSVGDSAVDQLASSA